MQREPAMRRTRTRSTAKLQGHRAWPDSWFRGACSNVQSRGSTYASSLRVMRPNSNAQRQGEKSWSKQLLKIRAERPIGADRIEGHRSKVHLVKAKE